MRYVVFILILAIVLLSTFIYSYKYFLRVVNLFNIHNKKKAKIVSAVVSIFITSSLLGFIAIITISVLHWFIIGLFIELINLVICKILKINSKRWSLVYKSGIIPILITAVFITYGYINMKNIVKTEYNIKTDKNFLDDAYKIGMISDLHYGVSINADELKEQIKKIEDEDIDMFILCGDIVDENTKAEEMKEVFKVLGNVKSKYGTFYVYGNHDSLQYATNIDYTKEELTSTILDNNIKSLKDESFKLTDDFTIVGRLDASMTGDSDRKSSHELLEGVDKNDFVLLLDHQPLDLQRNSEEGYDLQLSGHTHAGQIWPGGQIMRQFNLAELSYGEKRINDFTAITSSGIQGWGFPVRTTSCSEYLIVNVEKK